MYIYYDEKTDYLEVLQKKCKNYSVAQPHEIFKILPEKGKKTIG